MFQPRAQFWGVVLFWSVTQPRNSGTWSRGLSAPGAIVFLPVPWNKPTVVERLPFLPSPPQTLGNQLKAAFFIPQLLNSVFTDLAHCGQQQVVSTTPSDALILGCCSFISPQTLHCRVHWQWDQLEMSVKTRRWNNCMLRLSKQRNLKDCNPVLLHQLQRRDGSPFYPGGL